MGAGRQGWAWGICAVVFLANKKCLQKMCLGQSPKMQGSREKTQVARNREWGERYEGPKEVRNCTIFNKSLTTKN